jgi:hypothetical protein
MRVTTGDARFGQISSSQLVLRRANVKNFQAGSSRAQSHRRLAVMLNDGRDVVEIAKLNQRDAGDVSLCLIGIYAGVLQSSVSRTGHSRRCLVNLAGLRKFRVAQALRYTLSSGYNTLGLEPLAWFALKVRRLNNPTSCLHQEGIAD